MNQHPLARVHPEAKIGENVTIDPFAVIEKDVVIGDNCHIFSHAVILDGARIGSNCNSFLRNDERFIHQFLNLFNRNFFILQLFSAFRNRELKNTFQINSIF